MKYFFISLVISLRFTDIVSIKMSRNGTFLYFAYGSNLLQKRLHVNNPSAERYTHAKLQGYRLDFTGFSRRWGGAVATIEPDTHSEMWGAVWSLDNSHQESLDEQEGVQDGVYRPLTITVTTEQGEALQCRTYRYNLREPLSTVPYANLPQLRRPSPLYLETILHGAKESNLPLHYYKLLTSIPSNDVQSNLTLNEFLSCISLVNKKY